MVVYSQHTPDQGLGDKTRSQEGESPVDTRACSEPSVAGISSLKQGKTILHCIW